VGDHPWAAVKSKLVDDVCCCTRRALNPEERRKGKGKTGAETKEELEWNQRR